jgi:hypothetical protein
MVFLLKKKGNIGTEIQMENTTRRRQIRVVFYKPRARNAKDCTVSLHSLQEESAVGIVRKSVSVVMFSSFLKLS